MLQRTVFAFLNHLLAAETWATARLKPFAGQHARFEIGPFVQAVVVAGDGRLAAADDSAPPAVTIQLPADTPFRLLGDRAALLGSARISGTADFAEALGFVVRNLRWDVEADLARGFGDIAAHRLARAGRRFVAGGSDGARRLAANIGEYAEAAAIGVRRAEAEAFARDLDALVDALARLEHRLGRLG